MLDVTLVAPKELRLRICNNDKHSPRFTFCLEKHHVFKVAYPIRIIFFQTYIVFTGECNKRLWNSLECTKCCHYLNSSNLSLKFLEKGSKGHWIIYVMSHIFPKGGHPDPLFLIAMAGNPPSSSKNALLFQNFTLKLIKLVSNEWIFQLTHRAGCKRSVTSSAQFSRNDVSLIRQSTLNVKCQGKRRGPESCVVGKPDLIMIHGRTTVTYWQWVRDFGGYCVGNSAF